MLLKIDTSVKWLKAVFSKILIQEEKPIATFKAICWKTILGTENYIQIPQAD